jgi:hypothetical protein
MWLGHLYNHDITLFIYWLVATSTFVVLMYLVITMPEFQNGLIIACIILLSPFVLMGLYGYTEFLIKRFNVSRQM